MNDDLGSNKAHLFCTAARAEPSDVLVELGVRDGAGSRTMLESTSGQGCMVIGVDPSPAPDGMPDRYEHLQTDSVTAAGMIPAPIYLVFIDTLHIREQVLAELFHYWPKIRVGGFAVFHDSNWPPGKFDHYLSRDWEQPIKGINTFFADAGETITRVDYPESHGMTFVKKLTEWNPVVPGMDEALADSRRLTEALIG